MGYRLLLLVHVTSVVLFTGNLVAAWLVWACARTSGEPSVLRSLYRIVNTGDRWLTPAPVIAIMVSGIAMARLSGLSVTGTGWIIWSLIALGISGVVFVTRLAVLQRQMAADSGAAFDLVVFRRWLGSWARWAAIGTALVVLALGLMVIKPGLPGF